MLRTKLKSFLKKSLQILSRDIVLYKKKKLKTAYFMVATGKQTTIYIVSFHFHGMTLVNGWLRATEHYSSLFIVNGGAKSTVPKNRKRIF
jgi:hypothetical protein